MRTLALVALSLLGTGCFDTFGIDNQPLGTSCGVLQGDPQASPAALSALGRLNCYREVMGLEHVRLDPTLSAAAQAHAEWLDATDGSGHIQDDPSHPSFLGRTVQDRLDAVGYPLDGVTHAAQEVVSFQGADAAGSDAVDIWMDTVYHREPLATPDVVAVGFGQAGIHAVMEVVSPWEGSRSYAVYPGEGQSMLEGSFDSDTESPDPAPSHGVVGLPITLTMLAPGWASDDDPYELTADAARSSLSGPDGRRVELLFLEPAGQPALLRTLAALPVQPLEPGTTWTVTLAWTAAGAASERQWSFATAPE